MADILTQTTVLSFEAIIVDRETQRSQLLYTIASNTVPADMKWLFRESSSTWDNDIRVSVVLNSMAHLNHVGSKGKKHAFIIQMPL